MPSEDYASLPLLNGGECLVDPSDLEWLSGLPWRGYVMGSGRRYASVRINGRTIYMHRLIMAPLPIGLEVDHINGDPLDNRRSNLRVVSHATNVQNRRRGYGRTGERNVYLTHSGHYEVKLQPKSGTINLGVFHTLEEAAQVARAARLRYFEGATR